MTENELRLVEGERQMELFKGAPIRKEYHDGEWFFSVLDVIESLEITASASKRWPQLKRQLVETEGFIELPHLVRKLKMEAKDGKLRETDCANAVTMFRIVQSIPSKKAELFKRWLAKVAFERIEERENPDLAIDKAILDYQVKGYSPERARNRAISRAGRNNLTEEWKKRGIKNKEYPILTNTISLGAFGIKTKEHMQLKKLKKENLRDHMTPVELAILNLGESVTVATAISMDAQGFYANSIAAKKGGKVAGNARKDIELVGLDVISSSNYLKKKPNQKMLDE